MSKTIPREKMKAYHAGRKPRKMKPDEEDYYYFGGENDGAEYPLHRVWLNVPLRQNNSTVRRGSTR